MRNLVLLYLNDPAVACIHGSYTRLVFNWSGGRTIYSRQLES